MNSFNAIAFHLILLLFFSSCGEFKKNFTQNSSQDKFQEQRKQMVVQQIMNRGITDSLLINAFLKVPRHEFVPLKYRTFSYADRPLPIGEGQTISQPFIVAYMTEVLKLSRTDKVLEIGTGSGYQAAILGELCDSIFTIEIIESLGNRAAGLLNEMGYGNIKVKIGDGYKGWEEYAPFDAIIVTCAPTEIPDPLQYQLREGGRMIIPVGSSYYQELVYLRKINGQLKKESVLPVRFVPMVDSTGAEY
ncbi:protein-L-isoaspartate(D-aspartate) O-methyltransferase [Bacteroidota bacterium]